MRALLSEDVPPARAVPITDGGPVFLFRQIEQLVCRRRAAPDGWFRGARPIPVRKFPHGLRNLGPGCAQGVPFASWLGGDFVHERQGIMSTSITVPVFYATTEGHTRRIAEQIASTLRQQGLDSEARDLSAGLPPIDWLTIHGVVVGASIYAGRHQKVAEDFAKAEARHLAVRPSAFFSVSLSAGSRKPAEVEAARALATGFVKAAGWEPRRVACFAGKLAYTRSGSSSGRSCGISPGARARRPMPAATMNSPTGLPCAGLRSRWRPTPFMAGARPPSDVRCDRAEFSAPPARFYRAGWRFFAFVGRNGAA